MITVKNYLSHFDAAGFVDLCQKDLISAMSNNSKKGIVFGASGGIDSLATAALCIKAARKGTTWPVMGLQMIDSRVRGESYHPEVYRKLGVELIKIDITKEAIEREKHLHMPPRWLTVFLMKLVLRRLPVRSRRWLILQLKSGKAPQWGLSHLNLLTLLHRLRIARLREFATTRELMVVICANRTEASLGYFVEQGVDDTRMGDWAPISGLYKTQVKMVARYLRLPDEIIRQRPSPGFGGVYDEEILGPYELVDPILIGFNLGYTDERLGRWVASRKEGPGAKESYRYVQFLRELSQIGAQKGI